MASISLCAQPRKTQRVAVESTERCGGDRRGQLGSSRRFDRARSAHRTVFIGPKLLPFTDTFATSHSRALSLCQNKRAHRKSCRNSSPWSLQIVLPPSAERVVEWTRLLNLALAVRRNRNTRSPPANGAVALSCACSPVPSSA